MTIAAVLAADQISIGYLGMAASGILVAVTIAISIVRHLGLERSVLWASTRALVQLLLVGSALHLVVDGDAAIAYSWMWVALMIGFATWTTQRRVGSVARIMPVALASYAAAAAVSLGVLFGFGVFELTGRTLVPLAGMVVGNSLSGTVLVAKRVTAEVADHRDLIEARLALGMTSRDAFAPQLRDAVRQALIPQIETTKAVGIVFLPGAMVGLILAGADPTDAVKVQLAVMYLVLGSVATTTAVMGIGLSRRFFSRDHRLLGPAPPPAPTPRR